MATNLTLVSGTTRIDLNDRVSYFLQAGYYPEVELNEDRVTETVKVQLRGDIPAQVQSVNRLFERARSQDPAIEKVYLEYQVQEGETAWRSRIYNGAVTPTSGLAREFSRGRVNVEIAFERDPFWEGPETTLPIGNVNNGKVFNCNDGSGTAPNMMVNSASVAAGLILGDLPTPVRLELVNNHTKKLSTLWIGMNNTRPDWTTGWMLEAEDALGITPVTATGASGGAIAKGQMTFGGTPQPILRWEITDSMVSSMRGQRVRMLLRAFYLGQYAKFKYKIRIVSGVTAVYETDWLRVSELYARHWLDLFDFRLPPWLEGESDLSGLVLELWAAPIAQGTWTWAFDDVMLLAQDGLVNLETSTEQGGKVVIDGERGWSEDAAGKKTGLRRMAGSLMLTPGEKHVFFFAMHSVFADDAPIDMSLTVSGSYRPRRLTI
ncbi:MAG: hypothetical protein ACOYKC_02720 [Anaerolineaceae bacterium]|jgi:hypothetical protein